MEKKVAKIIFLDFDGVLNTEYHQRQLQFEGKIWQDRHGAMRVIIRETNSLFNLSFAISLKI